MTRGRGQDAQASKEKTFASADEIIRGLDQLRAMIKPVDELKREGNPYRDAERSKLEFQIKDTLRDIFGEDSTEYQQNKNFRIKSTAKAEITSTLEFLENLIAYLEDRKLELEGKKPKAAPPPPQPAAVAPPPPPPPPKPAAPPPPPPPVAVPAPPPRITAPPPPPPRPAAPAQPVSAAARADAIGLLRKIGNRFHAVARQLRLRHEGRPTLEVEDEYDAQDVVHALLCLEFDEIRRETWQPGYAAGTAHTYFVAPRDRVLIEVKKTRQGVGAKEITAQLDHDTLYYWTHPDCQTLFCFVYDPEARVGDPSGLEKKLTREVDGQRVEVFLSPK
jgi:hypothetical protein